MNKVYIKEINWRFETAMTWDELSQKQYIKIMEIMNSAHTKAWQELKILMVLLNLKWYHFRRLWQVSRFGPKELLDLRKYLVGWCFKPFKTKGWLIKKLIYPAHLNGLENWTFGLFCYADTFYSKWEQTNESHYLNKLMACVFSADLGELNKIDQRAKEFEKVKHPVKVAVAINYKHLRLQLAKSFPRVFTRDTESNGSPDPYGWASVLDELSGGKFGNDRDTETANLMKIFIHLDRLQLKASEKTKQ